MVFETKNYTWYLDIFQGVEVSFMGLRHEVLGRFIPRNRLKGDFAEK